MMYNNEHLASPPPAHMGIPPVHIDPKTGMYTFLNPLCTSSCISIFTYLYEFSGTITLQNSGFSPAH